MLIMPGMEPCPARLPPALLADLRARHGNAGRAYHDWRHVEEMLALHREVEGMLCDPDAVLLAILFHDAVYDPGAPDNEERSAELLREQAEGHHPAATMERAARMVLATIRHELPEAIDESERADMAHFLDMDLARLGAPPERFADYGRQIRREHPHLAEDEFRAARMAALRRFAEREHIYLSDWGRARFEKQARKNLAAALGQERAR